MTVQIPICIQLFTNFISNNRPGRYAAMLILSRFRRPAMRNWRRGRDSNPRWAFTHSGFQDRRNRPLCHLSEFADWHGVQDLNLQPTVLETATLPIELTP